MRILHAIRSIDPRIGGPYSVIAPVIREQVRMGHDVALLATNAQMYPPWEPSDTFARRMSAEPDLCGAEICIVPAFGRRKPWSSLAFSPQGSRWLRRELSDPNRAPDLVHIHGVWGHIVSVAASLARRHSIPYLLEAYGTLDEKCLQMGSALLKKLFVKMFVQKNLRYAAFVHPASQHESDHLHRWVPEARLRIVDHGVDVPEFDAAKSSAAFFTEFPDLEGKRILLFLGRVTTKKQPELIVEAMARLRSEYPDLVLLLVGDDEGQMPVVRSAAEKHGLQDSIILTGFLRGKLKQGAFAVADLFALPSLEENFGIAPIEAMAHGTPVLVSPEVGSHVHVEKSGGGIVVPGNEEGVTEGIQRLLKADRKAMGQKGRDYVQRNLSWPAIVKQLDKLYQEMLEAPAPGDRGLDRS